jgi:hypothetical protein
MIEKELAEEETKLAAVEAKPALRKQGDSKKD